MSFSAVAGPALLALKQTKIFRDELDLMALVTIGSLPVQVHLMKSFGLRNGGRWAICEQKDAGMDGCSQVANKAFRAVFLHPRESMMICCGQGVHNR